MVLTMPTLSLAAGETREIEIRAAVTAPQTLRLVADWVYLR